MDATEYLYYGFGQVAFAIARSDGGVQQEEKEILHRIVAQHLHDKFHDISVSEIIFSILKSEWTTPGDLYEEGIKNIDLGSHHLTAEIKKLFLDTAMAIAEAFPPYTIEENVLILKLATDLDRLKKTNVIE